jgi:general secretion pathway protein I
MNIFKKLQSLKMARLLMKQNFSKGFSLLEVAIALLILSTSVIAIYQVISSSTISTFELEDRYIAREIGNNRVALMNTIDIPQGTGTREGAIDMAGFEWEWREEISKGPAINVYEYSILIKKSSATNYIYEARGYLVKK